MRGAETIIYRTRTVKSCDSGCRNDDLGVPERWDPGIRGAETVIRDAEAVIRGAGTVRSCDLGCRDCDLGCRKGEILWFGVPKR